MTALRELLLYVRRSPNSHAGDLEPSLWVQVGDERLCIAFRTPPIIVRRPMTRTEIELRQRDASDLDNARLDLLDLLEGPHPGASPAARDLMARFARSLRDDAPVGPLDPQHYPCEEPGGPPCSP